MRRTLYRYALWGTARNLVRAFGVFAPWLFLLAMTLSYNCLVWLGVDRPLAMALAPVLFSGCLVLLISGRINRRQIFLFSGFALLCLWLYWRDALPHVAVPDPPRAAATHAAVALPQVTRFGRSIHWTS
jgi:hypothetical protein